MVAGDDRGFPKRRTLCEGSEVRSARALRSFISNLPPQMAKNYGKIWFNAEFFEKIKTKQ